MCNLDSMVDFVVKLNSLGVNSASTWLRRVGLLYLSNRYTFAVESLMNVIIFTTGEAAEICLSWHG